MSDTIERALAGLGRGGCSGDEPGGALPVERLFPIRGNREGAQAGRERLRLPRRQIELGDRNHALEIEPRDVRNLRQEQRPGLARVEADVVRRADGQGHDPLSDALQVDDDLDASGFSPSLPFSVGAGALPAALASTFSSSLSGDSGEASPFFRTAA